MPPADDVDPTKRKNDPDSGGFEETVPAVDTAGPTGGGSTPREADGGAARIGRYVLRREVSRDESAVVYEAHDPELHRDVVVRVVAAHGGDRRDALLDAARAMTRLSHPSLVPIFDVGVVDDGVYLVMPRIGGMTLTQWIADGTRSWRDVLERFVRAARGVIAAHGVGVTHRDLTSDRIVLDGPDVLVTGFAFTPGGDASENAAADQKALRAALGKAVANANAPAWLTGAVARSWPSLTAFTDYVDSRLRRRRRVTMAAGAVVAIGVGVGALFVAFPQQGKEACPDPRPRLTGVWDGQRRTELEAGFKTAAPVIAPGALSRLVPVLDRYAERWRTTQIATCQATHVKRTQSAELFDRRQACLDERLEALRTLVATLTKEPATATVVRADDAVAALPDVGDCERDEQLMAMPARPSDPAVRARITAAERELDEIHAMRMRGEMKAGLERAGKAVESARSLGYSPVLARALILRAQYEIDGKIESEATLREAAQVAADARVDTLQALAWIRLVNHQGVTKGKASDAEALEPVAEAAVMRAGSSPDLVYEFHLAAGGVAMVADKLEKAEKHFTAALEVASDDKRRASAAQYRAKTTLLKKGPVAAIPLGEEALVATEKALGKDHPTVAEVLDLLAQAHTVAGNFDQAEAHARREMAILEAVYGPLHPEIASPLRVLTYVATMREKHGEARELAERSLAIAEKLGDAPQVASAHLALAQALAMSDGFDEARPHYQQGLALMEKARGKDHQSYVRFENDYAAKLVANGKCAEAAPYLEHSIAFFESKRPELTAMPRLNRALCAAEAGKKDEAIADLERGDAECRKAGCEPGIALSTMATLGRMLIETRRDKARGAALMNEARAGFEAKGMVGYVAETDQQMKALGVKRR